jgi:nucleoside-diphosphate-sugar epimerase
MGEYYVRQHTPHIVLRYGHLYGKEKRFHGLIGGYLSRIERGLAPELYGGIQTNDFVYIKDVARANMIALTTTWDKYNQIYNVGSGQELSTEKAGDIICKIFDYKGKIEHKTQRTVDPSRFTFSTKKASDILGFTAEYDFESGLKDMKKEIDDSPQL